MNKLKVGQKLYYWKGGQIEEVQVMTIGRKYFTILELICKFTIDSLHYKSPLYSSDNIQLYLTKQEILDKKEFEKLEKEIKEFFRVHFLYNYIALPQLQEIKKIIENKNN
jgi:hypothetical protein